MALGLEWKVEKRVAYIVFSGIPDMEIFRSAQRDLIELMNQSALPVHLIFDVRELEQFPPLIEFIRSPYVSHPRKGQIVVIGLAEKPLFRILVNSLVRGLRLAAHTANTLDEARAILLKNDASLTWD